MPSEYLPASDGLLARKSGDYAKNKLRIFDRYADMFATGMKNKWPQRAYVDLLAGSGRCIIADTGEEFDGSPLRSFRAPFTTRIFVESDPTLAAALQQRTNGKDCSVIQGNCNSAGVIAQIRDAVGPDALGLVFVDNLGLDVSFETLRKLSIERRLDLLIVIQLGDIRRNAKDAALGIDDQDRWTRFFGTDAWIQIVEDLHKQNAKPSQVSAALVELYLQQLASIGYPLNAQSIETMKNERNATVYRLMLVSGSPRAIDFFKKVESTDSTGQRPLLD